VAGRPARKIGRRGRPADEKNVAKKKSSSIVDPDERADSNNELHQSFDGGLQ